MKEMKNKSSQLYLNKIPWFQLYVFNDFGK